MSVEHPRACGTDAAAYALGALGAVDVPAFEAHLDTCVVCRDELSAFQHTVGLLALGADQTAAPKRLRRHVLAEVRADVAAAERRRTITATPKRVRVAFARPAMGLASAAVIALAAAGGIHIFNGGTQTQIYRAASTPGTTAKLRVSGTRADLIVDHLAQPKRGDIYEVWLKRGDRTVPAKALFSVNAQGSADVDVPDSLTGVSHVLVTEEPGPSGTTAPTTPVLIKAALHRS
jgi:anti-sigma-K factor RskA